MHCWNCNAPLPSASWGKISFRASCERCNSDLHCCRNCRYYKPGMSNDCLIPGTEWVSDRVKNNFCEEFALKGAPQEPKTNNAKKNFDNLFK